MDLGWIVGLAAVVLGSGGVLFYRQRQKQLHANTGKTQAESGLLDAQTDGVETGTLESIICILRGEIDRLSVRLGALEDRVTELEKENRGLKRTVDTLLSLVRRMWTVIRDNEVDIDPELAGDIYEAIEDSTA